MVRVSLFHFIFWGRGANNEMKDDQILARGGDRDKRGDFEN